MLSFVRSFCVYFTNYRVFFIKTAFLSAFVVTGNNEITIPSLRFTPIQFILSMLFGETSFATIQRSLLFWR